MSAVAANIEEIGIKGLGRVFIRPGTSDKSVLEKIFQSAELDVMASRQFGWVRTRYDRMVGAGQQPLIIDCGANIGLSCLFFSALLPKAKVVGIEPAHDNVELARKNTAAHPNIEIVEAAIHDQIAPLVIANPTAEKWAYRVTEIDGRTPSAAVEGLTIDAVMQRFGASRSLIVKVDIEGAEEALFRSNTGWLARTDLLIIETHDWLFPGKGTSQPLFSALAGRRFELLQNGENLFFFFR